MHTNMHATYRTLERALRCVTCTQEIVTTGGSDFEGAAGNSLAAHIGKIGEG